MATVRVRRLMVTPSRRSTGGVLGTMFIAQLLPLLFIAQIASVECAHVFEAYRLAQFDRGGSPFGSRRVTVNHVATSSHAKGPGDAAKGDLNRMIAVLRLAEATPQKITELIDERGAASVLLLIPPEDKLPSLALPEDSDRVGAVRDLERFLVSRLFDAAVYFAFEDETLSAAADQLSGSMFAEGAADRFQFVVSASEAAAVPQSTIPNFQGWVHAAHSTAVDSDAQPVIAVVASYDSFAAAPELAAGAEQNGSGVCALLELARFFARLYSDYRTQGSTSLLFVLTGASRFNFAGDRHWVSHTEGRTLDSIEFALCLDAIAEERLHLHVSKPPKTPEIKALYDTFRSTAAEMNIPFELVHKKINLTNPVHDWQHEVYSRRRIVSATLSSNGAPQPQFGSSSVLDRVSQVNTSVLIRNIRFVAEALSKHIYRSRSKTAASGTDRREADIDDDTLNLDTKPSASASSSTQTASHTSLDSASSVIGGSHDANVDFVGHWLQFLGSQSRVQPLIDKKSVLLSELEKTLSLYTSDTQRTASAFDSEWVFYLPPEGRTPMSLYKVKPFLFDVLLLVAILSYLFSLYGYTKFNSFSELWSSFTK